uniref:Uncharacterized protein n=1 Tax=Treponema paraluiscuniculi TaxID=53435 RepID=A8QVU0_9SPIR|nr:hypothetical protein [Treponema paraluiscuniculi]
MCGARFCILCTVQFPPDPFHFYNTPPRPCLAPSRRGQPAQGGVTAARPAPSSGRQGGGGALYLQSSVRRGSFVSPRAPRAAAHRTCPFSWHRIMSARNV